MAKSDKIVWGVAAGTHDASLTVMQGDEILFASHSERFSRVKNDKDLHPKLVEYALTFGKPTKVYWYENPLLKAYRKVLAGQKNIWLSPKKYMKSYGITAPIKWGLHHKSHAAAGLYTSPFDDAAVVVIDAIGEMQTTSIWETTKDRKLKKLVSWNYPFSIGLFYSAFTARVGLKPNEDEYILMGMSAYGNPDRFYDEICGLIDAEYNFHQGVRHWRPELKPKDYFDVAAAVQKLYEKNLEIMLVEAKVRSQKNNLVLMGGCALNCLANRRIPSHFENSWIMPNPGDAGSSLGAILAARETQARWRSPYTGYDIKGEYPTQAILDELFKTGMAGVANGKAEFGPRALGNRSLLADPRGKRMKDKVNKIKQRQEYRPFAPVIRLEDVKECFNVPDDFDSPYMQYVVTCTQPKKYPAIVHEDGTSRVQTVTKEQHPGLYELLTIWKERTGCPMLLNTSLNIKGQPIVNTEKEGRKFEKVYNVKVFS
jgi:carbamoyltransferase